MSATSVVILSKENSLAMELVVALSQRGLMCRVAALPREVGSDTKYLAVVLSENSRYSNDDLQTLVLAENRKCVLLVQVGFGDQDFLSSLPVSKIYIDQTLPIVSPLMQNLVLQTDSGHLSAPGGSWLYLTTVEHLAVLVTGRIFSFSESKNILLGTRMSYEDLARIRNPSATTFVDQNAKARPFTDLNYEYTSGPFEAIKSALVGINSGAQHDTDLRVLKEGRHNHGKAPGRNRREKPDRASQPSRTKEKIKEILLPTVSVLAAFLIAPIVLLVFATATALVSFTAYKTGHTDLSRTGFFLTRTNAEAAERLMGVFSKLPVISYPSEKIGEGFAALKNTSLVAGRVLALADHSDEFAREISTGGLGIVGMSGQIQTNLGALYRDMSLLKASYGKLKYFNSSMLLGGKNAFEYTEQVLAASKLAGILPTLMAVGETKTYMVLFQNNMELRPTGGFIGSFSLMTFSDGKLVDDTIYDVYSADGQLKGYVEPPMPIEKYLGEASWNLRDSNWDPDFPVSARRTTWFLDKSIDRQVDGVIAINLEVLKEYLRVLGSVTLADFGDVLDHNNVYEKLQHEVEDNFFPGSRKKAHYLSALASALFAKIGEATPSQAADLLMASLDKLESRDIQVYMLEPNLNKIFAEYGWDGKFASELCAYDNCIATTTGIVEANVGVNKANYYIDRKVEAVVRPVGDRLLQRVSVEFVNNAPAGSSLETATYASYVRALAPEQSELISVFTNQNGVAKPIEADTTRGSDRSEYGVFIKVLPGEKMVLTYTYSTPFELNTSSKGEIVFRWWKQSGTGEYPFTFRFSPPQNMKISSDPPLRLTQDGMFGYNSYLSQDFISRLSWDAQDK